MTKRILITGSSRGIGKAVALKLAESGFDIAMHYFQNTTAAKETQQALEQHGVNVSCP